MRTIAAGMFLFGLSLAAGCGGSSPPESPASPAPSARVPEPAPGQAPEVSASLRTAEDPTRKTAHAYIEQFYRGDLAKLHERFSDEMKEEMSLDRLKAMRDKVEKELGRETSVLREQTAKKGEYRGFVRWARFDRHEGVVQIECILRPDDSIAGLIVTPVDPSSVNDEK